MEDVESGSIDCSSFFTFSSSNLLVSWYESASLLSYGTISLQIPNVSPFCTWKYKHEFIDIDIIGTEVNLNWTSACIPK